MAIRLRVREGRACLMSKDESRPISAGVSLMSKDESRPISAGVGLLCWLESHIFFSVDALLLYMPLEKHCSTRYLAAHDSH